MAASKKKVVTKDDLRRLMKEKQSLSTKDTSRKINHPLAKYNSLNQLVCVLCNSLIKTDLLWNSHLQSKQHREKALAIKTQGPAKPGLPTNIPLKRKEQSDSLDVVAKKQKTGELTAASNRLPSDFYDGESQPQKDAVRERAKAALLAGYSSSSEDSDSEDEETEKLEGLQKPDSSTSESVSGVARLPADFFDSKVTADDEEVKPESSHNKKMSELLPEGFFDDPKQDAKVREVVYKNKEEEEWELFQKVIKEEAHVSEVIMEEEDEQLNIDRNIDEIDDQIQRWQEVENLHVKKETVLKNAKPDGQRNDDLGEDVDDEEVDDFLNWRAKKLLK